MSGNLAASAKGETSKPTSKTGYDRIDINKLFKKAAEPVAKTVTQKHGMQTLGKAPPARRSGASVVVDLKPTPNDVTNNTSVPLPQQQQLQQQQQQPPPPLSGNLGQQISQQDQQKWTSSSHPHGPPPMPMSNVPIVRAGPPPLQQPHHHHTRPGPDLAGNYQSQRFAQEFPSLEAGQSSDPQPTPRTNSSSQPGTGSGPQNSSSKSHDNQYGPGPILRPQTDWTQGGGRGGPPINREQGPERPNLGGPIPPQTSLGQVGPAPPPPLGAYPMQFRTGMAPPFMYPNGPGPGYYPQSGQSIPRYGMPVPPGAPPPREQHSDSHNRESNHRGRHPPPPMRPTQQFAVKPIIREEDMKRMDDIDQEGSWSSVKEEVDYNKKISFSDEDDDKRESSSRKSAERNDDETTTRPSTRDSRDKKPIRILERQHSSNNNNDNRDHNRDRYENVSKDQGKSESEREDDWNNKGGGGRNVQQNYDSKGTTAAGRSRGRDGGGVVREDDWRGSRYEEDARNKKGPPSSRPSDQQQQQQQQRGTDYGAKQFSNLPPRLLRQQQHQHRDSQSSYSTNQRRSPSPSGTTDRDFQRSDRDREWDNNNDKRGGGGSTTQYRILERKRGDSESSGNSIRDKRTSSSSDYNKESTRGSSDSTSRDKEHHAIESLKEQMEGIDVRGDKEDKSSGFTRTAKFSTSSWADQVDDEDNYQKGLNTTPPSSNKPAKEERTVPKRVYIQQRRVENMATAVKVEVPPESIKSNIEQPAKQKQQQQQQDNKSLDKNTSPSSAVWGERDEREKMKSETTTEENSRNNTTRSTTSSNVVAEREIILSDKARQLQHRGDHHHHHDQRERENKSADKPRSQEKERSNNDYDKGGARYPSNSSPSSNNQELVDRERSSEKTGSWGNSRPNERSRPSRWGGNSNDYRNDNRTPERDANVSSGRSSSATDNSSLKAGSSGGLEGGGDIPYHHHHRDRGHEIEKSRSSEMIIKENSPVENIESNKGGHRDEHYNSKHKDFERSGSFEKRNKNAAHEEDHDRNSKGVRNKERTGHAVYQPRGGWGGGRPEDVRGGGRGGGNKAPSSSSSRGGGRDYYDNRPRRNDYDNRDDRNPKMEDHLVENIEKSSMDKDSVVIISNEEMRKDFNVDEDKSRNNDGGAGDPGKKRLKSPVTNKRNPRGGGRLHGYGPPSDKPFSSGNVQNKEEESVVKEKPLPSESTTTKPNISAGPVPLMELGDISPPSMMAGRPRHHGGGGRGGGKPGGMNMQQQQQQQPRQDSRQESYSSSSSSNRGTGTTSSKRGGRGGDAKPLMSLNSNELEKHEGDTESESQDDEAKKISKRKEISAKGHEKHRPNQNEQQRNSTKEKSGSAENQDSSNNNNSNKGKTSKSHGEGGEMYYSSSGPHHTTNDMGSASDNSEHVDSDGQPKKGSSKEKLNYSNSSTSSKTGTRVEKQQTSLQQQQQQQGTAAASNAAANKDRRVKHQPYDAHSRSSVAPRFQQNKESNESSSTWEKPSSGGIKTDQQNAHHQMSQPTQQQQDSKLEFSSSSHQSSSETKTGVSTSSINTSSMNTSSGGITGTLIFENRNYKNVSSKPAGSGKGNETKDSNNMSSGLELTKDIGLSFGKDTGSDSRNDMDFVSSFNDPTVSSQSSQNNMSSYSAKPMPIGQNRFQSSHQASPVSPLAKDLTEKIQAVRQVWDKPSMPSVAEQQQQQIPVSEDSNNSFHSGFTVSSDSFKADVSRDYSSSLQQSQSSYAPGSSPALAAISKPDSSTSPNLSSHRQVKPPQQQQLQQQQQTSIENHVGMSSSPFAYSMPQQHQGQSPFGGPSAIPSPPTTAMIYGNSQALGGHSGVYQAFPHVDSSQVMNNSARSQYGQYSNPPQGTGTTPYGLNTSIFMTAMDTGGYPQQQQMSSYQQHSHHQQQQQQQQQHSQQQQQQQSGQGPTPSNRSPGPMTSSGGGGGSGSGVMNSMKSQSSQQGPHPNMSHQVMGQAPSQQGYSQQMSHHHGGMPHHQLPPVGHVSSKPTGPGYAQSGLATQSQMYIPYDPSQQQVLNYGGQSYVSTGMRNAPQGGPPPSATPPVQGMQGSSNYYSGNAANQVFPGTNQGSGLQQLHVAVAPNPQALQNLQTATQSLQQYGQQQFQITNYNQLQGYSQQAASTVSALNLGGQLIRPPAAHSHYMKQGMDMVQQQQPHGLKSHEQQPMMNPTWNAQGFPLNQGFHVSNKTGGNPDRNTGPNIGNQRKGSHQQQQQQQQMGNMGNMGGGGVKYNMPTGGGYSSQQKGGRFAAPGPIQRPISTSPSTGPPPGSIMGPNSGMRMVGGGGGMKPSDNNLNKHLSTINNQPGSEEGLLDKFMTESHNRSIASTPPTDPSTTKVIMSGSRLMESTNPDHNGAISDNVTSLKNHNLTISPANKSPIITSSDK